MIKRLFFILVTIYASVNAQQLNNQTVYQDRAFFIKNEGQWNSRVRFLTKMSGMDAWITNTGVIYNFYTVKSDFNKFKILTMYSGEKRSDEYKNTLVQGNVVKMQFVNAEKNISEEENDIYKGYYNYFIDNDKSRWRSNVPLYGYVKIQGIYKNIDVKYYYDNGNLRCDFIVKPGADIDQIKFKFDGLESMRVNQSGELVLETTIGEVIFGKIYAYQKEGEMLKKVYCRFNQKGNGLMG